MNDELLTEMVLATWNKYILQTTEIINQLNQEQLSCEVATGRNRGVYIFGHLLAVHDKMLPILEAGKEVNQSLFDIYVNKPDVKSEMPYSLADLKERWTIQNNTLAAYFEKTTPEEWFEKHAAVSAEDFAADKKRNKLNVLLARIPHLTYHLGQLKLLKM